MFANNLLENTRGGLIAGLGVILLFWTVIKVLDNVEASFNDIWGVKKGRSFGRKISDYLALILICPLLLIASGGATVFVATQVQMLIQKLAFLGYFEWAVVFGLKLIPFVMSWLLFTFLYIFMPNTKVNLVSGIVGGVVAGTIYQATQMVYVTFQVGAAKANAIYGSFAALPLFLIWLQLSWRIVLFGTELVFAHQNVDTYEFEHDCRNASPEMRGILGCEIAGVVAKRFKSGLAPFSASELADELDIPIRLVRDVLFELTETGILTEIVDPGSRGAAYQPGRDISDLTIAHVLFAMARRGESGLPVAPTEELKKVSEALRSFEDIVRKTPANKLLKDL